MKRTVIATVVAVTLMTGSACARQVHKSITMEKVKTLQQGSGYLNHLSIRAARDFGERYAKAEKAKWFEAKGGYMVTFLLDSISCRAAYEQRGNWLYTIKTYEEEKMPRPVRHLVKSTYYDYSITVTEELIRPGEPVVYIVHMQDAQHWLNVQVSNGEMAVMQQYRKQRK